MMFDLRTLIAGIALTLSSSAIAVDYEELSSKKQTDLKLYVTAIEAYDLISKNSKSVLFVDVRTRAEVNFLGMPEIADANIPYMTPEFWDDWDEKKKNFKLSPNSDFLTALDNRMTEKGLTKNDTVVVICRSGSRSAKAVNLLAMAGYKKVYTVVDGYEGDKAKKGEHKDQRIVNGWKNSGLPWTYKLDKKKMYLEI